MDALNIADAADKAKLGDLLGVRLNGAHATVGAPSAGQLAADFLRSFDATGRHNLVAIVPDVAGTEGRTFSPGAWDEIRRWVDAREGRANLYFSVNEPAPGAPHKRLKAEDIGQVRAAHCDVDPVDGEPLAAERARLRELSKKLCAETEAPPTHVIDSGGGVQFLWRFDPAGPGPVDRTTIEAQNRGVSRALGGDPGTHDLARILRLPGTTNLPTAAKRLKGRERRQASMIGGSALPVQPDILARRFPPLLRAEAHDSDERIAAIQREIDMAAVTAALTYADLSPELRAKFETSCGRNGRIRQLWEGDASALGADKSGSGWRASLAHMLGCAPEPYSAEELGSLLWVWDHAIQNEEDRESKLSDRAIARDWARCYWPDSSDRIVDEHWEPIAATEELFPAAPVCKTAKRFRIETADEIAAAALQSGPKPLVKGLLDQSAMSVVYGASNSGKTFIALDLSYHVACGREWTGLKVTEAGVVYVATEGGRGAAKRVAVLQSRIGPAPRFFMLRQNVDLLRADADLRPLIDAICELGQPIGLIVIDTLSRAMAGGDENAPTDMGVMVKHFDVIRAATDAHVMIVHHSGKDQARGARGHTSLRAATDTEIEIVEGVFKVTKQRDLDRSVKFAFALEPVALGVDEDGDPVTSCLVRLRPFDQTDTGASGLSESELRRRGDVARAAYRALDGAGSAKVSAILSRLAEELAAAEISDGDTLPTIRGVLGDALGGHGVQIEVDGQTVRMRAFKEGTGRTAPWILVAMKVPGEERTDCPGELESLESARKSELFS